MEFPIVSFWAGCVLLAAASASASEIAPILRGGRGSTVYAVAADSSGNTYAVGGIAAMDGGTDAFVVKLGPDGKQAWRAILSGSRDETASGVAADSDGNVIVAGVTNSVDFPVVHAAQSALGDGATRFTHNIFAAKYDAAGRLIYSTYLGGTGDDFGVSLSADSSGAAYIAATSSLGHPDANSPGGILAIKLDAAGSIAYRYLHSYGVAGGIAVDGSGSAYVAGTLFSRDGVNYGYGTAGYGQAIVFKLAPDGSKKVWEAAIGGSEQTQGLAIAVDAAGSAYVAGNTTSLDFPLVAPLQATFGARPLWKSVDRGASWTPLDGLPFAYLASIAADSATPGTLFAAEHSGVAGRLVGGLFKSVDGGASWTRLGNGLTPASMQAVAVDPARPAVVYAGGVAGGADTVWRSEDGGGSWAAVDHGAGNAVQLAADATRVYALEGPVLRKSDDVGRTWNGVAFPGNGIGSVAVDPRSSGNLFAWSIGQLGFPIGGLPAKLYHSSDGGASWAVAPVGDTPPVTIDATTNPATVYAGLASRSTDNGATWTAMTAPFAASPTAVLADPRTGDLYAAAMCNGIYRSTDRGQSWRPSGSPVPALSTCRQQPAIRAIVPGGAPGTLYAVVDNAHSSAFISKLSPDGSRLLFSTLLGGYASMEGAWHQTDEPQVFQEQNWAAAIALDRAGNLVVAGGTRASHFLSADGTGPGRGGADAFVATIPADGSRLLDPAFFGGSENDGVTALAIDGQGNAVAGGISSSPDFMGRGGSGAAGGFVVRLGGRAQGGPRMRRR